jgi:2-polyprenyl-6-methoxyphenol hydroxylase-like FAD-dependent oxidoreductase
MTYTPAQESIRIANGTGIQKTIDDNATPHYTSPQIPVLIIGGGVVGCLTALKLGQAGIRVSIIERLPDTSTAPRACGYFGAVLHMLDECGMYKLIRDEGFMTRGLCFRKPPKDDGSGAGGKVFGDVVANIPMCAPHDTVMAPGAGCLNLPQAQLNKLFLREALKTGHVTINFNSELVSIVSNTDDGVTVLTRNPSTGAEQEFSATYAVAADGAKSATRKALGLLYPGHTWPERLIATNVLVQNVEETPMHTHFLMHPVHWAVSTPLANPVLGEKTLWRWTMAADPALEHLSDEEILTDENVFRHYERCMPGARPLDQLVEIVAKAVYRTHQRLVPTMRKGNVLLAGDAAHCNHVCTPESPRRPSSIDFPYIS